MVVFKKLFGEHPYWPILFTQLVLVLSGIWVFTRLLINKLYANSFQESALVAILFYPIFDANIQVINHIISGAASYALYLVIIALLFNWMKGKQEKYFYYSLVLIVPLMMFRSQFIFLIAVLFFFEILKILKQKRLHLKRLFLILVLVVLSSVLDKGYHKIVHGGFFSTPFTWISLNTSMLYVAVEEDVKYIDNAIDRSYFLMVKDLLKKENLGYEDNLYGSKPEFIYHKFHYELPIICNKIIHTQGVRYFYDEFNQIPAATVKVDRVNRRLFFSLLPHNFLKWTSLWVRGVFYGFGGPVMTLIWLLSWGYLFFSWWKNKSTDTVVFFALFSLTLLLLNSLIVSLSVHTISRYMFYNYWVPMLIVFTMFNKLQTGKITQ